MRVFDFSRAIVRKPGRSVVHGLRADPSPMPDYTELCAEHAAYAAALTSLGLAVDILPPLEAFPDSVFVEDPALVFPEGAIVLRPGAPSRQGEAAEMRHTLHRHFANVLEIEATALIDGGDVLVTAQAVFIGLSARTNRAGAESLSEKLSALGRKARIVETPKGVLHLKTAVSLLDEGSVLATRALHESGIFAGLDAILVPDGEEAAANALRVNDTVLIGREYSGTIDLLTRHGFCVMPLDVREIAKLDAGLSCMSLRW